MGGGVLLRLINGVRSLSTLPRGLFPWEGLGLVYSGGGCV